MALLVLFLTWLGCAFYASGAAGDKGHNNIEWFVGGLFFGPIALIAAAGLGDQKQRRYIRLLAESQGVDLTPSKSSGDVANDIIQKKRGWRL